MSLKTDVTTAPVVSAKERIAQNRKYHEDVFQKLGITDAFYTCKLNWRPKGRDENVIACFLSELRKTEDVYLEFTDRDFNPEDPNRTLYKLKHNPHYKEEYESFGNERYLVPVSYLIKVDSADIKSVDNSYKDFSLTDPDDDCSLDEMSLRDVAALLLKEPVSRKQWLNELISNRKNK